MPEIQTPQTIQQDVKEKTSPDKLIGYALLASGLLIIIATTIYAISVLTGKSGAPKVLSIEAPSLQLPSASQSLNLDSLENSGIPQQLLTQLDNNNQQPQPSTVKLLKDEDFSSLLNLGIFYLLVMFLASTGAKIASIGIQLIKDIKVKARV